MSVERAAVDQVWNTLEQNVDRALNSSQNSRLIESPGMSPGTPNDRTASLKQQLDALVVVMEEQTRKFAHEKIELMSTVESTQSQLLKQGEDLAQAREKLVDLGAKRMTDLGVPPYVTPCLSS